LRLRIQQIQQWAVAADQDIQRMEAERLKGEEAMAGPPRK
jgi:hypothetical protein